MSANLNPEILIPFLIYLTSSIVVALFARQAMQASLAKGGNFMEEYFVGGRKVGPVVLAFTFVATFASAGTFIGYPGLAYKNGLTVVMTGINQITTIYIAFAIVGKRMCVLGHRTGAVTFTDIMRQRFDHPLVVIGITAAILLFFIAFMVAQFSGAARILQSVAGVPYNMGVLLFGGAVALTVVIGGFRAVAWTDTLQGFMMMLGFLLVVPSFIMLAGGFEGITQKLLEIDPARVFGPGPGEWVPPSMLISFWILWVWLGVGNPSLTMRFLSARDTRSVHQAMIIGMVISTIFYVPMFYFGAGIFTMFPNIAPDQAIPQAYMAAVPPWLAGLCLAAPFAAVMSTVDSLLLTSTSAVVRDTYQRYLNPSASNQHLSMLSYGVSSTIGIGVLVLAFTPPQLLASVVIYFAGGVVSAFVVPVIAALYWPRATTWGAIAAIFGGFLSFLLIDIFAKNPFQIMSYLWGTGISALLMYTVSKVTEASPRAVLELFYGDGALDETSERAAGAKVAAPAE